MRNLLSTARRHLTTAVGAAVLLGASVGVAAAVTSGPDADPTASTDSVTVSSGDAPASTSEAAPTVEVVAPTRSAEAPAPVAPAEAPAPVPQPDTVGDVTDPAPDPAPTPEPTEEPGVTKLPSGGTIDKNGNYTPAPVKQKAGEPPVLPPPPAPPVPKLPGEINPPQEAPGNPNDSNG